MIDRSRSTADRASLADVPNWTINRLLPHVCLLCDQACPPQSSIDLCAYCRRSLPWNLRCCPRCALPGGATRIGACASCRVAEPSYRRCVAPLLYRDEPLAWVRRMKFHHGLVEGRLLGTLLAEEVREAYRGQELPDVLVPVPVSLRRLVSRGHNQALTLATVIARHLDRPLARRQVTRLRQGTDQHTLSRNRRQSNLVGAFASRPWQGERVALIDDVMTTGATAEALASTLLGAGAGEVHVWCATRTPGDRSPGAESIGEPVRG